MSWMRLCERSGATGEEALLARTNPDRTFDELRGGPGGLTPTSEGRVRFATTLVFDAAGGEDAG